MEQAILALVSFSITLTLYLDRQRRIDMRVQTAAINRRFDEQTDAVDKRFDAVDKRFADQTAAIGERFDAVDKRFDRSERRLHKAVKRLDARIDELNRSVVELSNKMGQVEGRSEVLAAR